MKEKLVVFLCGLIGSGKTTYALSHFRNFTDLDYMNNYARKQDQINWTKRLLEKNAEVCHITTYPSTKEIEAFADVRQEFVLIDTDINQCKTNILIRNRMRDMQNITNVFKANIRYKELFQASDLPFTKINLFIKSEKERS